MTTRKCGDCQLCCKLVPERTLNKPANTRCEHQRHGVGCTIYHQRPMACRVWSCRWLTGVDTRDLSRPDRSHYVIDIMPDYVTAESGGVSGNVEAIQIWIDPAYPNAHRDPALRAYLERRAKDNVVALIRYGSGNAFALLPPAMTGGEWREIGGKMTTEHTMADKIKAAESLARIVPDGDD